ncbi:CPBP family intramembrane glutamic endopeptidase, partial [Paenibacillus sp. 1001270B_150601_E10]|uniref:CPBP family intramembrane glutamic endopeptidase n=1 Tax=Paenibacillus sp. 1001270B_150601_E10 TaxID=2787079 RepID=UPI001E556CCB
DIHMSTGQLVGYRTELTVSALPSSSLPTEDLLKRSDKAVQLLGYSLKQVVREPVEQASAHEIRYRVPGAAVGDASLHISVNWSGDQLASITSEWSIPEDYRAAMAHQDNTANAIQTYGYMVVSFIMGLISIILAVVFRKKVKFRSATMWVLTIISCGISILHVINLIPGVAMLSLSRAVSFDAILFTTLLQIALTIIQGGVTLYFSLVTGKHLWQRTPYPSIMPTWSDASFGQQLVDAFWRGLCFAGVLLGLQSIIFTGLEYSVQAWSSTDAENSPLNLTIPAFFPLVAWVAAISEETFFRLFGVGLLRKLVRNTWIAAIIPTFVWAAGHVTYPIYPYYSRPVELMILGFVFVWIMVRYNFWTALFAHLMLDTLLMVISYLLEGTAQGMTLGLIYLLLPVILVYAIRYFKEKKTGIGIDEKPKL